MGAGLLYDYFGNFSMMKDIVLVWSTQGQIEPTKGENETNLRKQEKLRKLKTSFWVEGIFIDHS